MVVVVLGVLYVSGGLVLVIVAVGAVLVIAVEELMAFAVEVLILTVLRMLLVVVTGTVVVAVIVFVMVIVFVHASWWMWATCICTIVTTIVMVRQGPWPSGGRQHAFAPSSPQLSWCVRVRGPVGVGNTHHDPVETPPHQRTAWSSCSSCHRDLSSIDRVTAASAGTARCRGVVTSPPHLTHFSNTHHSPAQTARGSTATRGPNS
jgi:hypothetical protein